ncbi:MAG TPA: DUF72 domain-containing protein [Ramlibacter sp.]|jgi:uncharacterized protein YecE (DUF72 family)|uniref:DUF72 domain-containing protein n=1 Tax=Ramlibacter sp. TaxID=1917967 RepID=UPI002D557738|nr:DUF72 domain-containing protein [Ramlibacter sp.]HZY17182.1 DUF72 domain-containing protein [Ramlibacter sp.]
MSAAQVRVGVGGWTFEPWRNNFYPKALPHSHELRYASRHLTAIEVNGTFYSTFQAPTFAKWRDETPDGFVFSLKAHRSTTHRRELATAGDAIERFLASGLAELGDKLGPIVWPFMPAKAFDPADLEAFLSLLPSELAGRPLRHVLDVRHPSFDCEAYLQLARRHGCVTVHTDSPKWANIVDAQAPFAYLRLMRSQAALPTGYPPQALDDWADGCRRWTAGARPRDAFVFFINGDKERAPAAATALLERLGWRPTVAPE